MSEAMHRYLMCEAFCGMNIIKEDGNENDS
jgi:hypothetical protein